MAEAGEAAPPQILECERHKAGTRLTCSECGTPICPRCMVRTDVGLRCEPCAAPSASTVPQQRRTSRGRLALGAGALVASVVVLVAALVITRLSPEHSGDPASGQTLGEWAETAALQRVRGATEAVTLRDGRVAVVGGGVGSVPLDAAEIFEHDEDAWTRAGSLQEARRGHTAVVLADGGVLVAGGIAEGRLLASAELADPAMQEWSAAGTMNEPRLGHAMTLLGDGTVLVTGGTGVTGAASQGSQSIRPTATAEVFDPDSGTWTSVGPMLVPRFEHTATLLSDGRVLIAGGIGVEGGEVVPVAAAEIYDPASGTFSRTGPMRVARTDHAAVVLADGRVLVVGGDGGASALAAAEIFDLSRAGWSDVAGLRHARRGHSATLLPDGSVIVAGGEFFNQGRRQSLNSAERYDPEAEVWASAGAMRCPRSEHAAALLPDGTLLVAAGDGAFPGQPPVAQSCVDRYAPSDEGA